jgi:hypothetical protein
LYAERQGDLLDLVAAPPQLIDEGLDVQFSAALDERHLDVGYDDPPDVGSRWQIGN